MRKATCAPLLLVALGLSGIPACRRERADPAPASGAAAGVAGAVGVAGAPGGGAPPGAVAGAGPEVPPEPAGEDVLTLVHGVVDASRLWFCLSTSAGESITPGAEPASSDGLPFPNGGLGFAESLALESIGGFDPAVEALVPVVLAASEPPSIDCAEAIALAAGPAPGLGGGARVLALPAIPARTLNRSRGYLLVARGCLGGPELTSEREAEICGSGYTPEQPTLAAILVSPSRYTVEGRAGVQVVHAASWALEAGSIDIETTRQAGAPIVLASDVIAGAVVPRTPLFIEPSVLGVGAGDTRLEVLWQG